MELNDNTFYLRTSKLDNFLYKLLKLILFKSSPLIDLKSYYNRRILLKLLIIFPKNLVYIEKYKKMIDFRFFGYTIIYVPDIESIGMIKGDTKYIYYYDYGDRKIVKEIIDILNTKYHEHQQELITTKTSNP